MTFKEHTSWVYCSIIEVQFSSLFAFFTITKTFWRVDIWRAHFMNSLFNLARDVWQIFEDNIQLSQFSPRTRMFGNSLRTKFKRHKHAKFRLRSCVNICTILRYISNFLDLWFNLFHSHTFFFDTLWLWYVPSDLFTSKLNFPRILFVASNCYLLTLDQKPASQGIISIVMVCFVYSKFICNLPFR